MKGTISMQIEIRYFWQGAASQQDLSAKEIELTDTELAAIYGGADRPVEQQQTSDDQSVEQQQTPTRADQLGVLQRTPTTTTPATPILDLGGILRGLISF
jgi:bacteriocin-like protein